MQHDALPSTAPLFPLQTVLFPEGLLTLKVFEARYVDLITSCMRDECAFGAIALQHGGDGRKSGTGNLLLPIERVGVMASLIDVDSTQPGILHVRCRGLHRFEVKNTHREPDGLWVAHTAEVPADAPLVPPPDLHDTVRALANAIASLKAQGSTPFLEPYQFDSVGWVANRWCEILPISVAAKQRLMELPDPLARLKLVDEFLRSKGVVS